VLKGQAKTDYQREYMRRRRAKQAVAKPKLAREPTQAIVKQIAHWIHLMDRRPWRLGALGREVLEGLDLTEEWTSEEWTEACHRFKAISAIREQERKPPEAKIDDEIPKCHFCGEPRSGSQMLVRSDHGYNICEACVMEAVEVFAAAKAVAQAAVGTI
jgi:hypothetical protein